MSKSILEGKFRLVNQLEDGRKVYLSAEGKIILMTKADADYWVKVGNATQQVMVDGYVYSQDLKLYGRRSYWLERLEPFAQVVTMTTEPADAPIDSGAYVIGGLPASKAGYWTKPAEDYRLPFVVICAMDPDVS